MVPQQDKGCNRYNQMESAKINKTPLKLQSCFLTLKRNKYSNYLLKRTNCVLNNSQDRHQWGERDGLPNPKD